MEASQAKRHLQKEHVSLYQLLKDMAVDEPAWEESGKAMVLNPWGAGVPQAAHRGEVRVAGHFEDLTLRKSDDCVDATATSFVDSKFAQF